MVIGESADFMQANLKAGKTYYTNVRARMGVMKARFSFDPLLWELRKEEINKWMRSTKQMTANESGLKWAAENAASIKSKKAKYLPKWKSKPNSSKQTLRSNNGK